MDDQLQVERRPRTQRRRTADEIIDVLVAMGVTTILGVPGGAISPVYDACLDRPELSVIHTRHETGALFMCVGRWKLCPGSVSCVLVTSGPGITNAMTGMATALAEGVPVVVIAGEVPRTKFGRGALQEGSDEQLDTLGMVRSVTCSAERINVPNQARFQLAAAITRARDLGGPVLLSLPLDVGVAHTSGRTLEPWMLPSMPTLRRDPATAALARAAELLRTAERPLVLAGSGALRASSELRRLAGRLNLPVITSPKAKGVVSEYADYCLGVFGYGGHPSAREWLEHRRPDVTLALGCGFGEPSTNSWSSLLQPSRALIQVDLDGQRLGRAYLPDLGIVMDCATALTQLDALLGDLSPRTSVFGGLRCVEAHRLVDDEVPLGHARVLQILQEELPSNTVYAVDIGEHLLFALHYLRLGGADQLIVSYGFGSMGSGIAGAVGAKLGMRARSVVAICGDFGFQMQGMELNTCVQEGLDPIFVVMNDQRMRMVEAGVARNYGRCMAMDGPLIDFAALARSHGARGFVAVTGDELRMALKAAAGPTVIDVRVDPRARFPINPREQEISNFTTK